VLTRTCPSRRGERAGAGPDPNDPNVHIFLKGCDGPGEGGQLGGPAGADPTGGDGQTDCTLGAVYKYNRVFVTYTFVSYVCQGFCQSGQACQIESGSTLESEKQVVAAQIACECK
jgi:hypothetical protein